MLHSWVESVLPELIRTINEEVGSAGLSYLKPNNKIMVIKTSTKKEYGFIDLMPKRNLHPTDSAAVDQVDHL